MVQPEKTEMLLFLVSNLAGISRPFMLWFTHCILLSFPSPFSSLLPISPFFLHFFFLPLLSSTLLILCIFPFLLHPSLFSLFYPILTPSSLLFSLPPSPLPFFFLLPLTLFLFLLLPPLTQAGQYMLNFEATHCVALPRDFLVVPATGNL